MQRSALCFCLVGLASGCQFSAKESPTYYCSAQHPDCPEGMTCAGTVCVAKGSSPDGALDVNPAIKDGRIDSSDRGAADARADRARDASGEAPQTCGDGERNGSEDCEGADLGGKTCQSLGFASGKLFCSQSCSFDTSYCSSCGDQKKDGTDACDGTDLGNATYTSLKLGFGGGTLSCYPDCSFDTRACTYDTCGNKVRDGSEPCEGTDLGGQTCQSAGFQGGTLSCYPNCTLNTTSCYKCGDQMKNGSEDCDGPDLVGKTCAALGWQGGALACGPGCTFDQTGCYKCGDGVKGAMEPCEGNDLGSATCQSKGFDRGTLKCTASCALDTSECTKCGDGVRSGSEACDGNDLGGETCESKGFTGGTLKCASCAFDTGSCTQCGDGLRNGNEECEGTDLGGSTCVSKGFTGGSLSCGADCKLVTSGCIKCGDGIKQGSEECDGTDFGGQTCQSKGFFSGTLSCASCIIGTAGCTNCGNGTIQPGEQCDGSNLNGRTCATQGFAGGTLACSSSCTFNTSGCTTSSCGNGTIETGEQCDGTNLDGKTCATLGLGFTGGTLSCTATTCRFDTSLCCKAPTPPTTVSADIIVDASTGNNGTTDSKCIPYKTITAALAVASAGKTVWVAPGNYGSALGESFPLNLPDGVNLVGDEAGRGGSTLIAGTGSTSISPAGGGSIRGFVIASISGYGINGSGYTTDILKNTFNGYAGVGLQSGSCASLKPVIQDNQFNTSEYGVHAGCTPLIKSNGFADPEIPIYLEGAASVYTNDIKGNGTVGVYINSSGSPYIYNNTFARSSYSKGAIMVSAGSPSIYSNNLSSVTGGTAIIIEGTAKPELGIVGYAGRNIFAYGVPVAIQQSSANSIEAVHDNWPWPATLICGNKVIVSSGAGKLHWGTGSSDHCSAP